MSDIIILDESVLWEQATKFIGWGYSLNTGPTYPKEWMLEGAKRNDRVKPPKALQPYFLDRDTKKTNCCMFTESVLLATAWDNEDFTFNRVQHSWNN